MFDISDSMEVYLSAEMRMQEWQDEFIANYYKPAIEMLKEVAIEGAKISPNVDKSKLMRRLSPEAQKKLRGI